MDQVSCLVTLVTIRRDGTGLLHGGPSDVEEGGARPVAWWLW